MIEDAARRRIWAAFVANGCARVARMSEQLLLVPILLSVWGADRFGEWTALTSIASVAFVASAGIGQAGSSDIVLRFAGGDREGAARSLVTSITLLTIMILAGCALLVAGAEWLDLGRAVSLHAFSTEDARLVILTIAFSYFAGFYIDPLAGVVNAVVGSGPANLLSGTAKVAEIIAIAVAVHFSATPVMVATITLASVLLNLMMMGVAATRVAPWLSFSLGHFDISALQRTWRPSLGYFALVVLMTFVYMQVPRLLIFRYFGASTLASFTVLFTYTRAARMVAMVISQSAQVEMSRAFGSGKIDQFTTMIATLFGTTVGITLLLLIVELLIAPFIVPIWTRGNVAVDWSILPVLALVSLIGSFFDASFLSAAAINRVAGVAVAYGISLAIGLVLGAALLPQLGPVAVALSLIVPEIGGSFAAVRTLQRVFPSGAIRAHAHNLRFR